MQKQTIFRYLLSLFFLSGSLATVQAMRANPPKNLDKVMMGQIDGDLVELAVASGDESLVTEAQINPPTNFFEIVDENDLEIEEDDFNVLRPFFSDTTSEN